MDHDAPMLDVEFALDILSDAERASIAVGSAVYVTSRSVLNNSDLPERTVAVRLRRLFAKSTDEIERIDKKARALRERLDSLAE
ncbi:hypothetical protein ACUN7V_02395 [Quadrisphaera oryzae]|uniref:hypothetical protein n=1 Tax=Quadrisphaera TaxID=317661 RepID=UPI001644CBCA|nr:hypothetical protein [Quadrisphaera sp. RL12-1S]MBC3761082.1 hypothetical protein [Quadrisphaera sp. RL12-1S]